MEQHAPAKPAQQTSTVEVWRLHVEQLLDARLGPQAILDRLRSLGAIKRLVARICDERGVEPGDVAIPVETESGEVAQVDLGYVGRLWDSQTGRLRKA